MADGDPPLRYEDVREHEGELTERQRRTLELITAGKTNAAIAEEFGISLAGAKWHVSEVLSKLGFTSREEAAAYWRWRNRTGRQALRSVRSLAPLTLLKAGAGAAAAAVAVGAVLLVLASRGGDDTLVFDGDGAFYLEARVLVEESPFAEAESAAVSEIRWWYADRFHYRIEIAADMPEIESTVVSTIGVDGDELWTMDGLANTYSRSPIPPEMLREDAVVLIPGAALMLGYAPGGEPQVRELLERAVANSGGTVTSVGEGTGTILGRTVLVLEYAPTWTSVTGGVSSAGGASTPAADVVTYGGVGRVYFDPSSRIILANEFESQDQQVSAEVTRLDLDAAIPAGRFELDPPDGAVEQTSDGGFPAPVTPGS